MQNDHGDWDTVHHAFTDGQRPPPGAGPPARRPSCSAALLHGALRVYLDRFLNVPAARLPSGEAGDLLAELAACWDVQGQVDVAGGIVAGYLRAGGDRRAADRRARPRPAARRTPGSTGSRCTRPACARRSAWPEGSEESALILVGVARFLAAHTPTRRELPTVVRIATRLRRGEALFEEV